MAGPRVLVLLDNHGDVIGLQCSAGKCRPGGQQRTDVGGEITADVIAQNVDGQVLDSPAAQRGPAYHPQPQGVVVRRAREPVPLVVGLDIAHHDCGIAEFSAAQHHLQPIDQRAVAAPVGGQRPLVPGGLRRVQVGDDVATAECVDGLLGVADENQCAAPTERAVDHLPLHRVGVLELIDHDHRPALLHSRPGRRVLASEGIGQPQQQVVVAEDAPTPLAGFQLFENVMGETDTDRGPGSGRRIQRPQLGGRVGDHRPGDPQCVAVGQRGVIAVTAEVHQVEIVDNLGDQLVEVFDQRHTRVGVTRDAQRLEHQLAELVCGGNGCRIESGQRVAQALLTRVALGGAAVEQVSQQLVVAGGVRVIGAVAGVVENPHRIDHLASDPLTKFLTGRPPEGDEQHLVEPGPSLRDVAGHQRGQRECLARAGAGLEHRGGILGGQWAEQIEGAHQPGSRSARSIGSQSRAAKAPSRLSSPLGQAARSDSARTGCIRSVSLAFLPQVRT